MKKGALWAVLACLFLVATACNAEGGTPIPPQAKYHLNSPKKIATKTQNKTTKTSPKQAKTPPATSGAVTYTADVLPIIQANCAQCHSQSTASAFNAPVLTTWSGINTPYLGKKVFTAGNPQTSIIYLRITGQQQPQMPLGKAPLPANDIQTIKEWIQQGAKE